MASAFLAQYSHYQWSPGHNLALAPSSPDGVVHPPDQPVMRRQTSGLTNVTEQAPVTDSPDVAQCPEL